MKRLFKNKKGIGFVDSGVKILIAVVIGAVLLGGVYVLTRDTVIATVKDKIEALFDYQGQTTEVVTEEPEPVLFSFIVQDGTFNAEEGMTWGEWIKSSYNSSNLAVISSKRIGRNRSDGSTVELYYNQNGNQVYVYASDLIDASKRYKYSITLPIVWK